MMITLHNILRGKVRESESTLIILFTDCLKDLTGSNVATQFTVLSFSG